MNLDELDGRLGEGWGGISPNGSHVNVMLARRGSPSAAAATSMLAHPSPGHTPVLVCVGPEQPRYEPVWPPTLMMNKATALDAHLETLTWGAAQLGIAQGVLDSVSLGHEAGDRGGTPSRSTLRSARPGIRSRGRSRTRPW
jgi:formaldehyde-activating enzyme